MKIASSSHKNSISLCWPYCRGHQPVHHSLHILLIQTDKLPPANPWWGTLTFRLLLWLRSVDINNNKISSTSITQKAFTPLSTEQSHLKIFLISIDTNSGEPMKPVLVFICPSKWKCWLIFPEYKMVMEGLIEFPC